jgi:hypothetical protein
MTKVVGSPASIETVVLIELLALLAAALLLIVGLLIVPLLYVLTHR